MKKLIKSRVCGTHEQCIYALFTKDRSTVAAEEKKKKKRENADAARLCTVHGSYKLHFLSTFSLKMGLTILFIHLKIILLQCFQFLVFNFSKINSIQIDP